MSTTDKKRIIVQQLIDRFGNEPGIEKVVQKSENYMEAIRDLIEICGDDPNREGLEETPYRVLKAFLEYTEGNREDPKQHLEKVFAVEHDGLIMVKDIEFHSMCEHHFAPFFGVAHIAYIPSEKITGLSKIARMVDGYAKRFQVQERLSNQIVDAMNDVLQPQGAMVVIEAKHMCMCGRGVKKSDAMTVTTATRGVFSKNPDLRKEFMSLLG
ncbi:GTP cyclohydrolase I FolE [Lederbergia galactosidilytica]|uniref:GTP cyclohydrolase 1 n=1 Tax=Lederbergia galactosidilytica TaxID=217031 RepID=A0A0Q9XZA5_9BACI|nr:GTP cyclohydrolase I FolE [Lederbergia galactosidilytica]KRG14054.1 GTP cyclohydrolase [Lederbergia galactosidilytica]KRG16487.1 GTP cyclohydrolase [Virgibacillus soli]MBP1914182.1 GTP cyclohydrolase I [Lederbergia galactosidilytica]OAK67362.1 GTP cyclohydrolase [Lederbergia galactosidilytica]